jgi:hypothetical protein
LAFPKRIHDPDALLDYPADWSAWLPEGDTLVDVTVVTDDGVTVENVQPPADGVTVAWISGGTAGESYTVTYHVVTAEGREDDRSITLVCKER